MAWQMNDKGQINSVFAITKVTDSNIDQYIAERVLFFMQINSKCAAAGRKPQFDDPELAARLYEVVPLDNGGFKLITRKHPLKAVDDDLDGHNAIVARMSKTLAEQCGAAKMRGKFNDGALLLDECAANYSVGEVADFIRGE